MKLILTMIIIAFPTSLYADSCRKIAKYEEMNSTIYVVCPNLMKVTDEEANNIVESIFSLRKFEPDEYQIYFVKSESHVSEKEINSKSLVGRYYTHDNRLTIWPNNKNKMRIIQLKN